MEKYQSEYSAFSPNYEPRTPYGRMRKRMQTKQKNNVYKYHSRECEQGTYEVNHQILEDMKRLHAQKSYCKDQREMFNLILHLKKGLKKMQEKAKILNVDENTQIIVSSNEDMIKKQVVLDLIEAKNLIEMARFGSQM